MKLVLGMPQNSWRLKPTAGVAAGVKGFHWGDTDSDSKYIGRLKSYLSPQLLSPSFLPVFPLAKPSRQAAGKIKMVFSGL